MNVIRLNQDGTVELLNICKKDYGSLCVRTCGSAYWNTETILENFDLVYNDISEPEEEKINHNAEKVEPNSWTKFQYHAYIGDCLLVKTKPFKYKNGLVGTREISCTKEDFEMVKNFLNIKN